MRNKFLIFILVFSVANCFSQAANEDCDLFQKTIQLYNANAISPIKIENFELEQFQRSFLNILDPDYIIFDTRVNVLFDLVQKAVSEDLITSYCSIKEEFSKRYREDLETTIVILEKIRHVSLDFDKADSIYISIKPDSRYYNISKVNRCKNSIKSNIIQDVVESTSKYDSLKNSGSSLQIYIDSLKAKWINREVEHLNKVLCSVIEEDIYDAFINSLLVQYDQYSSAFSKESFNEFKQHLSTDSDYFGFQLERNNKGDIVIASVMPGSYAWRTGNINAGDKILKFELEDKESLETDRVHLYEILEFLTSVTTENITITILKSDNTIKKVKIYREKLENTENSVQAFILNGQSKTGYIILPAFYTSWDTKNTFGCAQDVGRAIYHLKKENIESLIIDLRNNGGGSIFEAIDLAGIFIDYGTFSVAQNRNNELSSIKDFNRGTLYSGPLALMVNKYSASASEMVAAVLQDYNRALVIGDTTYGKGVGQTLLPINSDSEKMLKVTTSKYFRVKGNTLDKKGVFPDITLPAIRSIKRMNINVLTSQNAHDSIEKKIYYKPLPGFPITTLATKSRERIHSNEKFQKIHSIDSLANTLGINHGYLPLSLNKYYQFIYQKEKLDETIDSIIDLKSKLFSVDLLPKDEEMIQNYTYYSDLYLDLSKTILSDPYIEETYEILNDYKTLK